MWRHEACGENSEALELSFRMVVRTAWISQPASIITLLRLNNIDFSSMALVPLDEREAASFESYGSFLRSCPRAEGKLTRRLETLNESDKTFSSSGTLF